MFFSSTGWILLMYNRFSYGYLWFCYPVFSMFFLCFPMFFPMLFHSFRPWHPAGVSSLRCFLLAFLVDFAVKVQDPPSNSQ